MEITCILLTLFLAAANGANDNGKGVATLAGANVASYKKALVWANFSTLAGALLSGLLADRMLKVFSTGIVSVKPTPMFTLAVLIAVGAWVALATACKLPVSTTHAIVGALVGCGFIYSAANVNVGSLIARFAIPLLLSIGASYALSATLNHYLGHVQECTCVGLRSLDAGGVQIPQLTVIKGKDTECKAHRGFVALHINQLHWLSSGLVGFGRGLNDTPKIVAIALTTPGATGMSNGAFIVLVSLAMFVGGVVASARVARRMGDDVIKMDPREGALANVTTSTLLTLGANLGWPMSTTHVSTGAITGVAGTDRSRLTGKTLRDFVLAWLVTPPTTGLIAAGSYFVISRV
jgi:inorganic phosphate transporter, PiT family